MNTVLGFSPRWESHPLIREPYQNSTLSSKPDSNAPASRKPSRLCSVRISLNLLSVPIRSFKRKTSGTFINFAEL